MSSVTETPPKPSSQPDLTPQLCFNSTALHDFLRLSRSTVDDSLSLHLNSLLTPARRGFNKSVTSARSTLPAGGSSRRQIPEPVCQEFARSILFPSWRSRDEIFAYCSEVAEKPEDPPLRPASIPARQMRMPSDKPISLDEVSPLARIVSDKPITRNYWGKEQVVNERLDPYSARDYGYTRQPKTQELKDILQTETDVERIIRARTWGMLNERCLGVGKRGAWEYHYRDWLVDQSQ